MTTTLEDKFEEMNNRVQEYICIECGILTDYYKPGLVCGRCEQRCEAQMEDARGN